VNGKEGRVTAVKFDDELGVTLFDGLEIDIEELKNQAYLNRSVGNAVFIFITGRREPISTVYYISQPSVLLLDIRENSYDAQLVELGEPKGMVGPGVVT